jgi:ubiquinone/menaquinone biosynthesis C-methylase UbiE
MSSSFDPPQKESTYFIDPEDALETTRLMHQARLITKNMGKFFPGNIDLSARGDILDIACGPGAWALDVAFEYPEARVVGIDISDAMVRYANAQALSQNLQNVSFEEMDVLKGLDLHDQSFDIVNARLLASFMPRTAWPLLIQECRRILRPEGIICLTEANDFGITSSPACEQLTELAMRAMYRAGLSFSERRTLGITPVLGRFLQDAGFRNIQYEPHIVDYSAGSEAYSGWYHNFAASFHLMQPFIVKAGVAAQDEVERLYQQALVEFRHKDFRGHWFYCSIWGEKS